MNASLPFLPPMKLSKWVRGRSGQHWDLNVYPSGQDLNVEHWLALRTRIYDLELSLMYQAAPREPEPTQTSPIVDPTLTRQQLIAMIQQGLTCTQEEPCETLRIPINMYMTLQQWNDCFCLGKCASQPDENTLRLEFTRDECAVIFPFAVPITDMKQQSRMAPIERAGTCTPPIRRLTPPRSLVRSRTGIGRLECIREMP